MPCFPVVPRVFLSCEQPSLASPPMDATDPAKVFGRIYETDHWRGGSGEGST